MICFKTHAHSQQGNKCLFSRNSKVRPLASSRFMQIQKRFLKFVPHEFDLQEAARRFSSADKKRGFAPSEIQMKSPASFLESPLKQVLIHISGLKLEIKQPSYYADYGINRTTHIHVKTITFTVGYAFKGILGSHHYDYEQKKMTINEGFKCGLNTLEEAMECYKVSKRYQDFNPTNIDRHINVDSFKEIPISDDALDRIIASIIRAQEEIMNKYHKEKKLREARILNENLSLLEIDPLCSPLTEKKVQEAFRRKLKTIHTDTHKGNYYHEQTIKLIQTRNQIIKALRKNSDEVQLAF